MNFSLLVLLSLNFAFIGALPRIFFRSDGKFNLMWWVTAMPLFLNILFIVATNLGWLNAEPFWFISIWASEALPTILASASMTLIAFTLGAHRVPLALWHQENDAPVQIVTWGPYKYVRHPFYVSFILAQMASVLAFPHYITCAGLIWTFVILNLTAAKEETRLASSQFGSEYRDYMKSAGRFFPKLRKA